MFKDQELKELREELMRTEEEVEDQRRKLEKEKELRRREKEEEEQRRWEEEQGMVESACGVSIHSTSDWSAPDTSVSLQVSLPLLFLFIILLP